MDLNIIHIDDDPVILEKAYAIVNNYQIGDYQISINNRTNFEDGLKLIEKHDYDLIILDLCVGKASEESDKVGEQIYNQIREKTFAPIVFFTGLPGYVEPFCSDIVKVASKGAGYDELFKEIEAILSTNYLTIKADVNRIVRESLRSFFWDFVHPHKPLIDQIKDDTSLSYILLRRLAKLLSKEQLKKFLGEGKLNDDLSHPVEFYIYPPLDGEYETGDIVIKKDSRQAYVVLTPSCDLVVRKNGERKAESILLIELRPFEHIEEFSSYKELYEKPEKKDDSYRKQLRALEGKLRPWMTNNKGDRYFFLPATPFFQSAIADFQRKLLVNYSQLENDFELQARLDDPFAQSMISTFSRYYNRIGFPDLDIDYAFEKLFPKAGNI